MKTQLTLLLLAFGLSTFASHAQTYSSLAKVQGESRVYAIPEMLDVYIPLQVRDSSYEACNAQLVKTYNELSGALIKAGISKDDIRSQNLIIQEYYNYYDRERKLEGYTGNISIAIKVPHSDNILQTIMRTMRDKRFGFGYSMGFSLSDNQKNTLEQEAIKAAIADARQKADAMAEALGSKLVAVQEINYGYTEGRQDFMVREKIAMADAVQNDGGDLSLTPQRIEVYRNVGVIWLMAK